MYAIRSYYEMIRYCRAAKQLIPGIFNLPSPVKKRIDAIPTYDKETGEPEIVTRHVWHPAVGKFTFSAK